MADYWIKLYTEIIDDPKMALLPDRLWRRVVELFLLAKKANKGGELPRTREIAWLLRIDDVEGVEKDLTEIEKVTGIIIRQGDGWFVANFARRQESVSDVDRKRFSREKKQRDEYKSFMSRNVTDDVTKRDIEAEEEKETEKREETETEIEAEEERGSRRASASAFGSPKETAIAISAANEFSDVLFAEEVYTAVTEMATMPPSIRAPAVEIILSLRSKYPDRDVLIGYLKPFFERWTSQRGKNGKNYSPLGLGWLEWALAGNGSSNNHVILRRYAEQWKSSG